MKAVARIVGGRKGSFAQASLAEELTGCVVGAIPPVAFNSSLKLVVDKQFLERESEIAFNAGRLDRSIVIDGDDVNRIGFFLHVPMPPPEVLASLPNHEQVIPLLLQYDVVGFQTDGDSGNFVRGSGVSWH